MIVLLFISSTLSPPGSCSVSAASPASSVSEPPKMSVAPMSAFSRACAVSDGMTFPAASVNTSDSASDSVSGESASACVCAVVPSPDASEALAASADPAPAAIMIAVESVMDSKRFII